MDDLERHQLRDAFYRARRKRAERIRQASKRAGPDLVLPRRRRIAGAAVIETDAIRCRNRQISVAVKEGIDKTSSSGQR